VGRELAADCGALLRGRLLYQGKVSLARARSSYWLVLEVIEVIEVIGYIGYIGYIGCSIVVVGGSGLRWCQPAAYGPESRELVSQYRLIARCDIHSLTNPRCLTRASRSPSLFSDAIRVWMDHVARCLASG